MKRARAAAGQRHLRVIAPSLRFPITICVLCYGANAALANRFLQSLYENTDSSLFLLRAGLNEVERATRELFNNYAKKFGNITLFEEPKNIFKNPLMRRMFHQQPLQSKWVIWADDDSYFTRPDWLQRLALRIENAPDVSMWGWLHRLWSRDPSVAEWIRQSSWYRGVPFVEGTDLDGHSAIEFRFAPGAFWVLRTEVLQKLQWPDPRLVHANEDFLLGEALRQNGFRLENFNYGVTVNDAPRRNQNAAETHRLTFERGLGLPSCSAPPRRG